MAGRWMVALIVALLSQGMHAQQRRVDDAMLRAARPDGEWLTHGGDYAEARFSTLNQITSANVDRLGLAWSVDVGAQNGRVEATPLVYVALLSGMLTNTPLGKMLVFALDAKGEL